MIRVTYYEQTMDAAVKTLEGYLNLVPGRIIGVVGGEFEQYMIEPHVYRGRRVYEVIWEG